MDAFIGEIRLLPYTFAPSGWAACQGQSLAVSQYQALFAIIGTMYGGNGTQTFNLPDLRSFSAVGAGHGPGLTPYVPGQVTGIGGVNLTTSQIPAHTHFIQAGNVTVSATTSTNTPSAATLLSRGSVAAAGNTFTKLYTTSTNNTTLAPNTIGAPSGAIGAAHDNHQPYLALQFCIALTGIFPPHS